MEARSMLRVACTVGLAVLGSSDVKAQWVTTGGPAGAQTRALTFDGGNASLFAGTAAAGLFVSSGAHVSWTTANNGLTNSSVLSLAASTRPAIRRSWSAHKGEALLRRGTTATTGLRAAPV